MLEDRAGSSTAGVADLDEPTEGGRVEETQKTEGEQGTDMEWFRGLIENASDAIAVLDEKGTILYELHLPKGYSDRNPNSWRGRTLLI